MKHIIFKWPSFNQPFALFSFLLAFICLPEFIKSQNTLKCANQCNVPNQNTTCFGRAGTCLRLFCEEFDIIWKKDEDILIMSGSIVQDQDNYGYEVVRVNNINYRTLIIKSLKSTDIGYNKYQGFIENESNQEIQRCFFNILVYGLFVLIF